MVPDIHQVKDLFTKQKCLLKQILLSHILLDIDTLWSLDPNISTLNVWLGIELIR